MPLASRHAEPNARFPSPLAAVIDDKLRFHHTLTRGRHRSLGAALAGEHIAILPGFRENLDRVRTFFSRYYREAAPRVALVGINPGRFGGGKTGLPFLDPPAVRALLGESAPGAGERSARFLWEVIAAETPARFFAGVYVTNLSWFGFLRDGRNLNFDALPEPVQSAIEADFVREATLIQPRALIPLGSLVSERLMRLRDAGRLTVPVLEPLPHPRWCAFPSRRAASITRYRHTLAPFLRLAGKHGRGVSGGPA